MRECYFRMDSEGVFRVLALSRSDLEAILADYFDIDFQDIEVRGIEIRDEITVSGLRSRATSNADETVENSSPALK